MQDTRFQAVWVRPGASFARYQRIWPVYAGFSYEQPPDPRGRDGFALSDRQIERLEASLRDVFRDALREGGWRLAEAQGPDVLLLRAALLDVVVNVPPERPSSDVIYVDSAGEATLLLELYDSQTRQIVARIVERGAAEAPGGGLTRADSGFARGDVRRLFRGWARKLGRALDAARTLEIPEA